MPKTNYQRDFIGDMPDDPNVPYVKLSYCVKLPLSDRIVGASAVGGDATRGKHGIAKRRRGAKKFVNSRTRFHENKALRELGVQKED